MLQRMLGRGVEIVTLRRARSRARSSTRSARAALGSPRDGEGDYRFLCTGDVEAFRALGTRFLQLPLGEVEHVDAARGGGGGMSERSDGRAADELRPVDDRARLRAHRDRLGADHAGRDARHLHRLGRRRACRAGWPGSGRGWVTAEYGMLPASTGDRKQRDVTRGRPDGRTVEIQRLIGRSLRGVVDFEALGERTIYLDCDVLQADGGTRCASITGAYVALALACERLRESGSSTRTPLTGIGRRGLVRRSSTACRCSTSTTPRTRPPRSTRTSS